MALENYKRIYFIGIGGIGMSALARYFYAKGYDVAGYDKTPSPLTDELKAEGMDIHFEDLGEKVPEAFRRVEETLVVYTPAIKALGELSFFQQKHTVLKRSEVLGLITQSTKGLGVAGTHGKTTTSTMLAHVLAQSHLKCSAFLGGISSNFNSNVVIDTDSEYSVIEADEFDRSFLRLSPFASIITAMDPDHLDIYGTTEEFSAGFQAYADKHIEGGFVVKKHDLPLEIKLAREITYGVDAPNADYYGTNLRTVGGRFYFDLVSKTSRWEDIELGLPGTHNCENAVAVCAMCFELGLSKEEIFTALCSFMGVRRRFEYHLRSGLLVYIDDYAHHPTEIGALINSVRLMYPGWKVTGIFQPHLFSRTRDFMDGFAAELSRLDEAILMPIYPAREEPIPGITSDVLLEKIDTEKSLMTPAEVIEWSKSRKGGVVLTIGAGDIDRIVPEIAVHLTTWLA